MTGRIVVGVDGSAPAAAAVGWAATEARLRRAELVVCSVVEPHSVGDDTFDSDAILSAARAAAGGQATTLTRQGDPSTELLAAGRGADLLVVGSRGRSRLTEALLGSVSRACVTHAPCPVVVVRHPSSRAPVGRVVAGLDGSVHARAALLLAAEEAQLRGTKLQVLHAVYWDNIGTELATPTPEQLEEWGHRLVDAELAATGVIGDVTVVHGHPGGVLVQHSGDADLLVVGTRGHNPAASLLLGSVSEHCVRYAPCPVLVTRAGRPHRADQAQADARGTTSGAIA